MAQRGELLTAKGLRLDINQHIHKVMGVIKNSTEVCTDHAVSLYSAIRAGIKLKIFPHSDDMDLGLVSSPDSNVSGLCFTDSPSELKPECGPLRVPTSESQLRQLGDQISNNRIRLMQAIPETPPSPCSLEPAESPSFRRNGIKRFSFKKRTRKQNECQENVVQDFDRGAFVNHQIAENCIGNLKVAGCNLRRKNGSCLSMTASVDSGLMNETGGGGRQPLIISNCLGTRKNSNHQERDAVLRRNSRSRSASS